jgi:ABC-type uncharacterized transport system substrate-binding protein
VNPMRRRDLILGLGGAIAAWSLAARAQQRTYLVGVLSVGDPAPLLALLREGLLRLGYAEGRNVQFEVRSGPGDVRLLRPLADELIRLKVDVIVTRLTPASQAAKAATGTIPIVMTATGAPVETGLIASLARPGGNITGSSATAKEMSGKRVQLVQEALPAARRVALLANAPDPFSKVFVAECEAAGRTLQLDVTPFFINRIEDFPAALTEMQRKGADALLLQGSIPGKPAAALALERRLPPFASTRAQVQSGALMAYSARFSESYRQAAVYIDKIFKGAKPADLPIEQPTEFELVINLRTAKVLGITVPQSILARADDVIE